FLQIPSPSRTIPRAPRVLRWGSPESSHAVVDAGFRFRPPDDPRRRTSPPNTKRRTMAVPPWLEANWRPPALVTRHRPQPRKTVRFKPRIECLENRLPPATITVTTTAGDSAVDGTVSLREAILSINAGANINADVVAVGVYGVNDTIHFNISASGTVQTINVGGTGNGALPALIKPMTISGYSEM